MQHKPKKYLSLDIKILPLQDFDVVTLSKPTDKPFYDNDPNQGEWD